MAVQSDTLRQKTTLDTPIFSMVKLNWEVTLYILLFILALVTRFYDLGARVMSHDESLHTVYSWNLYAGKGYQHDPLMHGPFLFHINALMYFLFGDNDYTARISTALFGTVLVVLPFWFRPWLGRVGALAASMMILISPGLLYYSRYIRHDIFVSVWTVLMFMAFFQYMRTRQSRWLYIGAAAVGFMLSTKEVAFIHGFIGATFILLVWMWENIDNPRFRWIGIGAAGSALLLGLGIAYLSTHPELLSGTVEANPTDETFLSESIGLLIKSSGWIIGLLIVWLGTDSVNKPVTSALASLRDRLPDLGKAVLLAVVIFVILHTTVFSNLPGLGSGTYGAVSYWLAQQEVQRGSQPWYYYLMLIPMYEFLPLLIGLVGGLYYIFLRRALPGHANADLKTAENNFIEAKDEAKVEDEGEGEAEEEAAPKKGRAKAPTAVPKKGQGDATPVDAEAAASQKLWPSDGGTFAAFTIYWTINAFTIYSWAGEKMPWLTVHMTLPFIFLAAHVIQTALGRVEWRAAWRRGGVGLGVALILTIPALGAILTAQPFQSQSLQSINETSQFIAALIILGIIGYFIWRYARQIGLALAKKVAFSVALLLLTLLTIRFAWLLTYINYDYVNEMLVYAHASPDVKLALQQIDDISERTVGDKMVKVAYDNDSTWPLEWYLREYPNRVFYGENPNRDALDAPVVIVGSANESKVKPFLGDNYIRYRYRLVWWPIEDYKNQTFSRLWTTYVTGPAPVDPNVVETAEDQAARRVIARENRQKLWNILFYRNYEDYDLNEWPFVHRFFLYVRKDVAAEVWNYQSGPVELTQGGSIDPYEGKRTELDALQTWGSNGTADGQFTTPRSLAVGPDGLIYVADSGNHRIQVFDAEGNFQFKWGSEGAQAGQFSEPWGIAVGPQGSVYVADTWNHRLQAFSPEGEFLWQTGTFFNAQSDSGAAPGDFWGPRGVAVDSQGNVYVTDTGNKRVHKFSPEGEFLQMWGGGGIVPGSFEEPVGIDLDSQDNIYVADTWNQRVQKFDPALNPIADWPVVNGWDSESVVNKPFLAVDNQDRLFISDPEGYRLIAYNGEGQVLATWGQYGQDLASVALPLGLDFDADGYLYLADSDNNRVMKFLVPETTLQLGEASSEVSEN